MNIWPRHPLTLGLLASNPHRNIKTPWRSVVCSKKYCFIGDRLGVDYLLYQRSLWLTIRWTTPEVQHLPGLFVNPALSELHMILSILKRSLYRASSSNIYTAKQFLTLLFPYKLLRGQRPGKLDYALCLTELWNKIEISAAWPPC